MKNQEDDSVRRRFLAPAEEVIGAARSGRRCPDVTDREHVVSGILRVLGGEPSGRGWVQHVRMAWDSAITVNLFFKALRSERRLTLVEEVDADVCGQTDRQCARLSLDPLSEHRELDGFAVYASDGHYEEASPHTPAVGGEVQPQGFFYSVNMRTHAISLLDVARPERKKEHDMHALKRLSGKRLRMGCRDGVKVIHVYDPAGIDYLQWHRWKTQGVYFISREKENSAAETVGVREWDRDDPRNEGVEADELVGVSAGVMIRRVTYRDPATGEVFRFITAEMTLPPGLVAFLYKMRWDVEKAFDEKKTKLNVKRAWATTPTARCQQAHFVCLAHNLMLMLEREIASSEGVRDEKTDAKRDARRADLERRIAEAGRKPNTLVTGLSRATQRSLQFIRWLRYCLENRRPWRVEIDLLKPYMRAYIS